MGGISRKTVAGTALFVAACGVVVSFQSSGTTNRVWEAAAYVNPATGPRIQPPYPAVQWNPFALKQSPIGKLLASFMIDRSDLAFHLGGSPVMIKPPRSIIGRLLAVVESATSRTEHTHADVGGHDDHDHEGEADGHQRQLGSRIAMHKAEQYIRRAFSLDPTNHDALELYAGFVQVENNDEVQYSDALGNERMMRRETYRAIWIARYALEEVQKDLNKPVPDGPVAAALNLMTLQGLEVQDGWKLPEKQRQERFRWYVEHMNYYLEIADQMEADAKQLGWWKLRPTALRRKYQEDRASAGAYVRMFETALNHEPNN